MTFSLALRLSVFGALLGAIALPAVADSGVCIELQYGGQTAGDAVVTVFDDSGGVTPQDVSDLFYIEASDGVENDTETGLSFVQLNDHTFQSTIVFTDGTVRDPGNGVLDVRCDDTIRAVYPGPSGPPAISSVLYECDGADITACTGDELSGPESGCWTAATTSTPGCTDCGASASSCGGAISVAGGILLHSGEYRYQSVDLSLPGRGLDFVWARTYRSRLLGPRTMGYGWTHGYDIKLYEISVPSPGEVQELRPTSVEDWTWEPPAEPGGAPGSLRYCVLRSDDPGDFTTPAKIHWVEELGTDTQSTDTDVPLAGSGYFYLVAAEKNGRQGSWGADSQSVQRQAENCASVGGPDLSLFDGSAGRYTEYRLQPGGVWHAEDYFREIRQEPDGSYVLEFPGSGEWQFDDADGGRISRIVDRSGNQISFGYDGPGGGLSSIVDTVGREIWINEDPSTGLIMHVGVDTPEFGPVEVEYAYDNGANFCTGFPALGCGADPECSGSCGPDGFCSQAPVACESGADCDLGTCFIDPFLYPPNLVSARSPVVATPTGNDYPDGKTEYYVYDSERGDELLAHNLVAIYSASGEKLIQNTYSSEPTPGGPGYDRVVRHRRDRYLDDIWDIDWVVETPTPANNFAIQRTIVNDSVGNVREHFVDANGVVVMRRDYTGRAVKNQQTTPDDNRPANPLRPGDPAYYDKIWTYNDDGLAVEVAHPRGNTETYAYSEADPGRRSQGNLAEHCRTPGTLPGGEPPICQSYEYDPLTNGITRHVDGRGNETIHDYDAAGNRTLTRERIPSVVHEWTYDAWGRETSHRWPDNGHGERRYDVSTYYGVCELGAGFCLDPADCGGGTCIPEEGLLHEKVVGANDPTQPSVPALDLTIAYEYDSMANVTRITDPRGNDTDYLYNELKQKVQVTSPETEPGSGIRYTTDFYYDVNNNLVRVDVENLDEDGILQLNSHFTTIYEYNSLNLLVRECSEAEEFSSPIDANRPECPSGPEFVTTEYEYDSKNNRVLTRHPEAVNGNQPTNVLRRLYDERDLLYREIRAEGDPEQSTTQYDYDKNGNLSRRRSGLEAPTPRDEFYGYDVYGRLAMTTDMMTNRTSFTYDDNGNLTGTEVEGELADVPGDFDNMLLQAAIYVYDEMDRRTEATQLFFYPDPVGPLPIDDGYSTTVTTYSDASQPLTKTDDNLQVTNYSYDSLNRLVTVDDPLGNSTVYTYDENANLVTLTTHELAPAPDPLETYTNNYTYDGLDRRIRTENNIGSEMKFRYDSRGNLKVKEDALRDPAHGCGNFTFYEYDGLGRQVETTYTETDPTLCDSFDEEVTVARQWDDGSRLVGRTDGESNATDYEYDSLNRLVQTTYEDGTSYQTIYDAHDNAVTTIDARDVMVHYEYDLLDRLTSKTILFHPQIGGSMYESFGYDGRSRLVRAENDDALVVRRHDSLSNVTTEILNLDPPFDHIFDRFTDSEYDGERNQLRCYYPGGRIVDKSYDALNRVQSISELGSPIADYTYRGFDRVDSIDFGNGTGALLGYDGLANDPGDYGVKRVVTSQHFGPIGGFDNRLYSWDSMQNKTRRENVTTGSVQGYTYELSLYRLTLATRGPQWSSYDLDDAQNRVSILGTTDPGPYAMNPTMPEPADRQVNQYTTTSFDSREYDSGGNLVTVDNGVPPTMRDVVYDYRNRMVEHVSQGVVSTYSYDPLGRRIGKSVTPGPGTTRYLYAGQRVIEEESAPSVTTATYVFGGYIDEVVNMERAGVGYTYHRDDLFNVVALTDPAGNVVERYEYDDFGRPVDPFTLTPIVGNPSPVGNPYLFNGRRYDEESGWYWYRTRYLDPRAGRFTSRDTIGMWGDETNVGNGYAYAGNNPRSKLDPFGRGVYPADFAGASLIDESGDDPLISWGVYPADFAGASLFDDGGDDPLICKGVYPADFSGASFTDTPTMVSAGGSSGGGGPSGYGNPSGIEWDFGDGASNNTSKSPIRNAGGCGGGPSGYGNPSGLEWDFGDGASNNTSKSPIRNAGGCGGGPSGYGNPSGLEWDFGDGASNNTSKSPIRNAGGCGGGPSGYGNPSGLEWDFGDGASNNTSKSPIRNAGGCGGGPSGYGNPSGLEWDFGDGASNNTSKSPIRNAGGCGGGPSGYGNPSGLEWDFGDGASNNTSMSP